MVAAIDRARESKDTLGGVFEVVAHSVPVGIVRLTLVRR
jgi:chorismate synthase